MIRIRSQSDSLLQDRAKLQALDTTQVSPRSIKTLWLNNMLQLYDVIHLVVHVLQKSKMENLDLWARITCVR